METQTITSQEFVNKISSLEGIKTNSFFTKTPLKLKKGWQQSGRNPIIVDREGRVSMIGVNYEKAVNDQRKSEYGDNAEPFVAESRVWGQRIMKNDGTPTPFVKHTKDGQEKLYLTIVIGWKKEAKFYDSITNELVDKSEFQEYLYAKSSSSRQNVEDEIKPRDYTLENIYGWQCNNIFYKIIHSDTNPVIPID